MLICFYKMILGLTCSLIVAAFGYLARLLTFSGTIVSVVIGTLIITIGPWYAIFLLGAFFASSGVIHKVKESLNKNTDTFAEKSARRDGWQVLANSLPALMSLTAYAVSGKPLFIIGYAAAICGTTADTWASELGVLSRKPPRAITTLKPIERGQSGGVSLLGNIASAAGAFFVAALFYIALSMTNKFQFPAISLVVIPALAGVFDSFVDSLLGATIQGIYRCQICGKLTEKRQHHGQKTALAKGFAVFNNDVVNFLSGLCALMFSLLLGMIG